MPLGERRLTATVPLLAAIAAGLGVSYWPSSTSSPPVRGAPSVLAGAEDSGGQNAARNSPDTELEAEIGELTKGAIADVERKGVDASECAVSVLVKELGVEGSLVEVNADRHVSPASNMKLATTAIALVLMRPGASFETSFDASVLPVGGVLGCDLVVRAGGDPLFNGDLDGRVGPLLEPLVSDLRDAGVRAIEGDLVLDLGEYSEAEAAPGWPSLDQRWTDYCALSSGFSANAGCVEILVRSNKSGPASVLVTPLGHGAELRSEVSTGVRGSTLDLKASVSAGLIRVWGEIPVDVGEWSGRFSHPDPVALFGSVVRNALRQGGIHVSGSTRLERGVHAAHTLAVLRTPIINSLKAINTNSNNSVADQLFLKVGADFGGSGSRGGGAEAALRALTELGLDPLGYHQVDGSGLSRDNRISARQLVTLLDGVIGRGGLGADAFLGSLALSGESGTLKSRMVGTAADGKVRAKTGFIGGVSSLSGLAYTDGGRLLVFSILVQYPVTPGLNRQVWKPMQDQICEALVRGR